MPRLDSEVAGNLAYRCSDSSPQSARTIMHLGVQFENFLPLNFPPPLFTERFKIFLVFQSRNIEKRLLVILKGEDFSVPESFPEFAGCFTSENLRCMKKIYSSMRGEMQDFKSIRRKGIVAMKRAGPMWYRCRPVHDSICPRTICPSSCTV